VFEEGLSEGQRTVIRQIARGDRNAADDPLLRECGLIERGPRVSDPVLTDYFRPPIIIHHISDVHFGPKSAAGVDRKEQGEHGKRFARAVGGTTARDDYVAHLRTLRSAGPHVILISGDLVETGTDEQYLAARHFVDRLSALVADHPDLGSEDKRVALVGGNHDVDWGETRGVGGARKRHLAFARYMDGYPHPHLELPPEERSLSFLSWPGVGLEIVLLGSAEYGGEDDEVQLDLIRIIDRLRNQARSALEANEVERFDRITEHLSRLDPGVVDYHDLKRVESHAWTQPVRFAMLHHPISPMPAPTEIARFGGLLNAGATKTSFLRAGICLVLHGHQHSGWFGRESWPGRYNNRSLHVAAAPTLGSRETLEHLGFNEVRVFREGSSTFEIEVRRVAYNGNGWDMTADAMSFTVS
jgi:3',5'-cyclic AMP phosphodiesterase CpdA